MTEVFVIVFLVMIITIVLMAIGALSGREPIKGSCGGLNNVGIEKACGCTDSCADETPAQTIPNPSSPKKSKHDLN